MDSLQVLSTSPPDPILIWTIVIGICGVANVIIAILMWRTSRAYTTITKNTFLASQRPYIGASIYIHNLHTDSSEIFLTVKLQNYGSVLAKKVDALIQIIVDGKILPINNSENKNQIFFPHWIHTLDGKIKDRNIFLAVKNGTSILEIRSFVKYYGIADKEYSTDEVCTYNPEMEIFIKKGGDWT